MDIIRKDLRKPFGAKCARDGITQAIREKIASGDWAVGSQLPSREELAASFRTSTFTVHKALTPLVKTGLLESNRRLGTFVRARHEPGESSADRLGYTGLVMQVKTNGSGDNRFPFQLVFHMQQRLGIEEQPSRTWVVTDDDPGPMEEVERELAAGRLRRLILFSSMPWLVARVRALGVPHATMISDGESDNVDFDARHFFDLAFGEMRRAGCRRIGVIANVRHPDVPAHDGRLQGSGRKFHEALAEGLARYEVETRPEWLVFPRPDLSPHIAGTLIGVGPGASAFMRYGYQAFGRLWESAERPEGLVVFSDQVAQGVVMAMLDRKVSVPGELRVAFHKNSGLELYAPFPALFVRSELAEIATALLRMTREEIQGPLHVPYRLETHPGDMPVL